MSGYAIAALQCCNSCSVLEYTAVIVFRGLNWREDAVLNVSYTCSQNGSVEHDAIQWGENRWVHTTLSALTIDVSADICYQTCSV
jgi:hypothetical protein